MSSFAALAALLKPVGGPEWAARVNYQVASRFDAFVNALLVTEPQVQDAVRKAAGIVRCLNRKYYGSESQVDHTIAEGSWGKGTQTRPPRDVDLIFVLPDIVYLRFEGRQGNKQSQILQEVKETLEAVYPRTHMRGDGQVVIVDFENGHGIEVVPAFALGNGQYWICNTHASGSYKTIDPVAEIQAVETSDLNSQGTTRELVRMLKRWQSHCNVETLKSFQIELLAIEFLRTVPYSLAPRGLYDWLVRDFFAYLIRQRNLYVVVPGTNEVVWIGDGWFTRAETAHERAIKASRLEEVEMHAFAREEWQKIFGTDI